MSAPGGRSAGLALAMTITVSCAAHRPPAAPVADCGPAVADEAPPATPAPAVGVPEPPACPQGLARRAIFGDTAVAAAEADPSAPRREGCLADGCWYHAGRSEWVVADGAAARLDVERPAVPRGAHSLAEIAVRGARLPKNSIEIGWSVSPTLFGDSEPHLFVHRWIAGEPCTGDCGWRQRGRRWAPGISLTTVVGQPLSVGWQFHRGRWWAFVEEEWIGYFEDEEWASSFRRGRLIQWFGEVFASGDPPGIPMGNGRLAEDPGAARFRRLCLIVDGRCRPFSPSWAEVTRVALYSVAPDDDGFRYGGPGEPTAVRPRPPPSSASGGTPPATGRSTPSPPR